MERGSRDHAGFIYNHQVKFVKAIVDIVFKRSVHRDVECTVQSIHLDVGKEDIMVTLSQQGHRGSDKDRQFVFNAVVDGCYQHLGFACTWFAKQDPVHPPAATTAPRHDGVCNSLARLDARLVHQ